MFDGLFGANGDDEESSVCFEVGKRPTQKLPKPPTSREKHGFVGLDNQGATCYLNSLIQSMYMTPELRSGLYLVDPLELGVDVMEAQAKAEKEEAQQAKLDEIAEKKKASSSLPAIDADENLVQLLTSMGVDEHRARIVCIATHNRGAADAFDYLERIERDPSLAPVDLTAPVENVGKNSQNNPKSKKGNKRVRSIPLELQRLFSEMQLLNRATLSTQDLTKKGFQWQSVEGHIQHDAHELNRLLIDALDRSLKRSSGAGLCSSLYEGKVQNQILCTQCTTVSEREEAFYDLNLQVLSCDNASVALHRYCQREILDGDSRYACEVCGHKTIAYRMTKLKSLPKVLTISCNRFRIDASTQWQRVKVVDKSIYPLILNINAFMKYSVLDGLYEDQELQHEHLARIESKMLWLNEIKVIAEQYCKKKVNCYIHKTNDQHISWSNEDVQQFALQVWQQYYSDENCDEYIYFLHAIIVHRGSAYSGHYFAYIRDNFGETTMSLPDRLSQALAFENDKSSAKQSNIDHKASNGNSQKTDSMVQTSFVKDFIQSNDHLVYISSEGLIADIISVFQEQRDKHQGSNGSQRGRRRQQAWNHQDQSRARSSSTSSFQLSASIVAREIGQKKGIPWSKLYKSQFGSVEQYLRQRDVLFVETDKEMFGVKEGIQLRAISEADFDALLLSTIANNTSQTNETESNQTSPNGNGHNVKIVANVEDEVGDDSPWQTVKAKFKSKATTNHQADNSIIENDNVKEDQVVRSAQEYRLKLNRRLREELLHRVFGSYFEFNDSRIMPVSYDRLESSFTGVNSAYLLVYRRIHAQEWLQEMMDRANNLISTPSPSVPTYWTDRIAEQNKSLEDERIDYEAQLRKMKLRVLAQHMMDYQSPLFLPRITDPASLEIGSETLLAGATSFYEGETIEVDGSFTVLQLLEMVENSLTDSARQYYVQALKVNETSSIVPYLQLSRSKQYGKGYYPMDVLTHDNQINAALTTSDTTLIMWIASGQHDVIYGEISQPLAIKTILLEASRMSHRNKANTKLTIMHRPVNPQEQIEYLVGTWTLAESCQYLGLRHSISPQQLMIHLLIKVAGGSDTSNMNDANHTMLPIYNRGHIRSHNIHGVGEFHSHSLFMEIAGKIEEMWIEDCDTLASQTKSLAIQWFSWKQVVCDIEAEVDEEVLKWAQMRRKEMQGNEAKNDEPLEALGERRSLQLEVHEDTSLVAIKHELHRLFKLEDVLTMSDTRLRTSHTEKEGLVMEEDEKKLINSFITSSRSSSGSMPTKRIKLYLQCIHSHETTPQGAGESLPLKISLVIQRVDGNSVESKYTIEQAGNRVQEIVLPEVDMMMTVQDLRDRIGVEMMGFPEGWSKKDEKEMITLLAPSSNGTNESSGYRGRRLRRTSWLKEFSDLLLEQDRSGNAVYVKDCGLRDGDLLLFEEGKLPVKGQINIMLFLWLGNGPKQDQCDNPNLLPSGEAADLTVAAQQAYEQRQYHLLSLGSLTILMTNTLSDLQQAILAHLRLHFDHYPEHVERLQAHQLYLPYDAQQILLRELRPDLLPGRIYWLHANTQTTSAMAEHLLPSLGNKIAPQHQANNSSALRSTPRNSSKSEQQGNLYGQCNLQRLGMKVEKGLVVEILPDHGLQSVKYMERGLGAFNVWIQRVLNPSTASKGTMTTFPHWPPYQITVQGGVAPSFGHLFRPIQELFSDLQLDNITVLKFNLQTLEWQEIHSKLARTICQSPYFVKEGDHFMVYNHQQSSVEINGRNMVDGKTVHSLIDTPKKVFSVHNLDMCLLSDLHLRSLREQMRQSRVQEQERIKKDKKAQNKRVSYGPDRYVFDDSDLPSHYGSGLVSGSRKNVRKEHRLILNANFDDWDEEDEEDQT